MLNKLSTKTLIIILISIVGLYALNQVFDKKGRSKSFKSELVLIDTAKVTRVIIDKAKETTYLEKQSSGQWKVKNINDKLVLAETNIVLNALNTLLTQVKPTLLASRSSKKHNEFQVDSTGTRVQVYQGNKKTLDLIIGKFTMRGQRRYQSYVRLYDEDEVYVCYDFMSIAFPFSKDSYRNKQLTKIDKSKIQRVSFVSQTDNSFVLEKIENAWTIAGNIADSVSVTEYLSDISYLNINQFADDSNEELLSSPLMSVLINTNDSLAAPIEISAYEDEFDIVVLKSSESPNLYLGDSANLNKIFKTQNDFLAVK